MLLYSNENLLHMTCEQEKCYNLINGNDKILIIKKRQSGASSLLATYVISELQEGYNKTICYMSPSSLMNEHLMYSIIHHFSSIYNGNGIANNTHKELKLLNGNRLICRLNTAESFRGEQKIDTFIYDEIGFEKGDFPALEKTLELYRPFKTIFSYTMSEFDKILTPCLMEIQEWLLTTDFKRILLPMLTKVQQKPIKDTLYENICKLYNQ